MTTEAAVAIVIFAFTFAGILSGKVHRTVAAAIGAAIMVMVGIAMDFYTEEEALAAIDFNTIGLLMGMMILVGLLEQTGFFQYMAITAGQLSRGSPWLLLVTLGTTTTVLSMFLDNVTTIVLIAPVTIRIAETLGIKVVPLLMAEALLSNTGGVATLVGDPPNIIIASAAGFSFNDYLTHSLPVVLIVWPAALLSLRIVFRRELAEKPRHIAALMEMRASDALHDLVALRKTLIVFAVVIVMFFLHEQFHLSPAFVAMAGASAGLLWVGIGVEHALERALESVEWSVLLFFAALFVTVGGLEASGLLGDIGTQVGDLADQNLLMASLAMLWTASIASAIVDNIPFTIAMVPIIEQIGERGIGTSPLWWALVFGAGFGGNGTPIGSTANGVAVTMSERTDTPITTLMWLRSGSVVMLVTTVLATLAFIPLYEIGLLTTP